MKLRLSLIIFDRPDISSHSQRFFKITVLKTSQHSQETPMLEFNFTKVARLKACNFKDSNTAVFL